MEWNPSVKGEHLVQCSHISAVKNAHAVSGQWLLSAVWCGLGWLQPGRHQAAVQLHGCCLPASLPAWQCLSVCLSCCYQRWPSASATYVCNYANYRFAGTVYLYRWCSQCEHCILWIRQKYNFLIHAKHDIWLLYSWQTTNYNWELFLFFALPCRILLKCFGGVRCMSDKNWLDFVDDLDHVLATLVEVLTVRICLWFWLYL